MREGLKIRFLKRKMHMAPKMTLNDQKLKVPLYSAYALNSLPGAHISSFALRLTLSKWNVLGVAWLRQSASRRIAHHWTGIKAGIPSPPSTASSCRHVIQVTSLITGSHMTTRKLQFAEEGPTLRVESYELSKTLRWCERVINSIMKSSWQMVASGLSLSTNWQF